MAEDHDECSCPFCDGGEVPAEIVAMIMAAAAGPMSEPMSLEEVRAWLNSAVQEEGPLGPSR